MQRLMYRPGSRSSRGGGVFADGSKINNISVARIADLSDVDVVITGESAPPEVVEQLREAGVTVEVAE